MMQSCAFKCFYVFPADMNVRRCFADVAALGPYLYICGGSDDQSRLNTVEKYDPFNNVWIPVPSMTTDRNGVGVTAGQGRIYAIGKRSTSMHYI